MDFQQARYTVETIVNRVRTGRLALPDFQRDFVWNPSQVVELLDTVARQWPIGTLLLLSGPQPFAIRGIDSGPRVDDEELDLYILDGQQRITALFHAFADVSDYVFYVDFRVLLGDDNATDAIKWDRRKRFSKLYRSPRDRAENGIVLVHEIWDTEKFLEWYRLLPAELRTPEIISIRDTRLSGLNPKVYHVMALLLEQEIDLEALARIFETINRTGVSLNAFDLLVAKLYPAKFNLREQWDQAKEAYPAIRSFEPDEVEPLKLVSLLIRLNEGKAKSRGVRQGDLLALDRSHIQTYWPEAISLYNEALTMCRDRFGATVSDLIPSWSMVLGLAGLIKLDLRHLAEGWWQRCLTQQMFVQAANTQIVAEFDRKFWPVQNEPAADEKPREWLRKAARANGFLVRGIGSLLVSNGAVDAFSGAPLKSCDSIAFRALKNDGRLNRLTKTDTIENIFLLGGSGERALPKSALISDLGDHEAALRSQGFGPDFRRNESFIEDILNWRKKRIEGEGQ